VSDEHSAKPESKGYAPDTSTAAPHPEEMKGTVSLNIGKWVSVTATGRATPAGFACAALLACALPVRSAIACVTAIDQGAP
jgi:hypothetical protein